jgi:hypothetical protein
MKIPNLILLTGLLFLPLASCKIRKAEQAKVYHFANGVKAFELDNDWFWNSGTGDDWVKNDSITPSTYTKARLVSEDEEKLMVEEDEQTPNEVEADPDTGADSGDAGDAGDAGGDD